MIDGSMNPGSRFKTSNSSSLRWNYAHYAVQWIAFFGTTLGAQPTEWRFKEAHSLDSNGKDGFLPNGILKWEIQTKQIVNKKQKTDNEKEQELKWDIETKQRVNIKDKHDHNNYDADGWQWVVNVTKCVMMESMPLI